MSLFKTLGKLLPMNIFMGQTPDGKYSPIQLNEDGSVKTDTEIGINSDVKTGSPDDGVTKKYLKTNADGNLIPEGGNTTPINTSVSNQISGFSTEITANNNLNVLRSILKASGNKVVAGAISLFPGWVSLERGLQNWDIIENNVTAIYLTAFGSAMHAIQEPADGVNRVWVTSLNKTGLITLSNNNLVYGNPIADYTVSYSGYSAGLFTVEVLDSSENLLSKINDKNTLQINALKMATAPTIVANDKEYKIQDGDPMGATPYDGWESIDATQITFWSSDGYGTINGSLIVSNNRNLNEASHMWIARNFDTDGWDTYRVKISNENLVKGDLISDYSALTGSMFASSFKIEVSDVKTQMLLKRYTLLDDQTYTNCQKISYNEGIISADIGIWGRNYKVPVGLLDFEVKKNDVLFGLVWWSATDAFEQPTQKWYATFTFKNDDYDNLFVQISDENYAGEIAGEIAGEYNSIVNWPHENMRFLIGRPERGNETAAKIKNEVYDKYDFNIKQYKSNNWGSITVPGFGDYNGTPVGDDYVWIALAPDSYYIGEKILVQLVSVGTTEEGIDSVNDIYAEWEVKITSQRFKDTSNDYHRFFNVILNEKNRITFNDGFTDYNDVTGNETEYKVYIYRQKTVDTPATNTQLETNKSKVGKEWFIETVIKEGEEKYLTLNYEDWPRKYDGTHFGGSTSDPETDAGIYGKGGTNNGQTLFFKIEGTQFNLDLLDQAKQYFGLISLNGEFISSKSVYLTRIQYIAGTASWVAEINAGDALQRTDRFPDILNRTNGNKLGSYCTLKAGKLFVIDSYLYSNSTYANFALDNTSKTNWRVDVPMRQDKVIQKLYIKNSSGNTVNFTITFINGDTDIFDLPVGDEITINQPIINIVTDGVAATLKVIMS